MRSKNYAVFCLFLVTLLVVLSGCATARRPGGSGWFSNLILPPILTVVLMNNTTVPIEVYENGQPVSFKDKAGNWYNAVLPSGGVVSRGYYNYLGRRDIVITVRGICPPTPTEADKKTAGCTPGQYAGTASRNFYIYTDGQYRSESWEINYLQGPRGVY